MISTLSKLAQKILPETSDYQMFLTNNRQEIEQAQKLRFNVFNLELQEGLASAYQSGLDQDPFDEWCDHLIVVHLSTHEVVGTYRMQTGSVAALHLGYYSAQEFDFSPYESIRSEIIELGRACIHQDHRNFTVLNLLWRGIAEYATARSSRYLIGCSSLTSQDPNVGATVYQYLAKGFLVEAKWQTVALPAFYCPLKSSFPSDDRPPKLLRAYLGVGAKICSPPAIDREFKTIDFLTMLDLRTLSSTVKQRFLK